MQIAKRLPLEDSDFIQKLRFGYVAAQVVSLAIYFYIQYQVSLHSPCGSCDKIAHFVPLAPIAAADDAQIKRKNDLTTLKYVQPASPMSQDEGGLVTTTVRDYDLQETSKAMKGLFTVSPIHYPMTTITVS